MNGIDLIITCLLNVTDWDWNQIVTFVKSCAIISRKDSNIDQTWKSIKDSVVAKRHHFIVHCVTIFNLCKICLVSCNTHTVWNLVNSSNNNVFAKHVRVNLNQSVCIDLNFSKRKFLNLGINISFIKNSNYCPVFHNYFIVERHSSRINVKVKMIFDLFKMLEINTFNSHKVSIVIQMTVNDIHHVVSSLCVKYYWLSFNQEWTSITNSCFKNNRPAFLIDNVIDNPGWIVPFDFVVQERHVLRVCH